MQKLIIKSLIYLVLLFIVLELLVRVFHLHTEDPPRFIDSRGVEKRVPNRQGYAVTGNRNQNFSAFRINSSGFNSYREYDPSFEKMEIAILGDSFIEGFHQDYDKSIGKKVEERLHNGTEVYEYGYAGYDLANQLHLIYAYSDDFEKIDFIIIYLDYATDLERDRYIPNTDRIALLSSPIFKLKENLKILSYTTKTGIMDPVKQLISNLTSKGNTNQKIAVDSIKNSDSLRLYNFIALYATYPFEKTKTYFLLNAQVTPPSFLNYLDRNDINYLNYGKAFEVDSVPKILGYDQHWNDYGRTLIAKLIADGIQQK